MKYSRALGENVIQEDVRDCWRPIILVLGIAVVPSNNV